MKKYNILTCNSHETYVWSLSKLDISLDIIDYLPGRYTSQWDTNIRPVPAQVNLISTEKALANSDKYDCIIAHSIDDLLLVKNINVPIILRLPVSLHGYIAQENSDLTAKQVQSVLKRYLDKKTVMIVAISKMKMESWDLEGMIIPHFIDSSFFAGYDGSLTEGLRVVNQFNAKNIILDADFHKRLNSVNEIRMVGFNPDIDNSVPSKNMTDLRDHYRSHRYYVHTARPNHEDGYNLASLEAMSVGMPLISNSNPSSPIINGVNGFISDDIKELESGIMQLINDHDLARRMGAKAREYVKKDHSFKQFSDNWARAIQKAIAIHKK